MKTVAFIFARGGSKGLPGKNIRPLVGKPLIAWSIEHALAVKRIERIIVSTDSEEIATVARNYYAEVPFFRPAELAQDDSPEWLAWQHALNYLFETSGVLPEVMVSVPTTAPLRLAIDIENCLDEYEKGGFGERAIIHGDPVFTNIIVKENQDLCFLDMRGEIGGIYTLEGDKWYDFGKILQSLMGYDEILLDKYVEQEYKNKMISIFKKYVESEFGPNRWEQIRLITSSLIFSLVPLHDNDKIEKYYSLIDF